MTCMKNKQPILLSSEIQLLMFLVMAGSLLAQTRNSPSGLKQTSLTRLPLNDVLFTEDVLLEVSARSRIDCSKKCVETEGCVMCTFHSSRQGPPGHCRLHSQLQNPKDAKKSMPGAKSVARKLHCDGGYVKSWDRCLKAVNKNVTYTTARQDCINMRGHLVMPRSQADADCLWNFVKTSSLKRSWVGADDLEKPREIRWSDGTLLPDNSPLWRWQDGDPEHNRPGGNCVAFGTWYPNFFDENCASNYQYLCQKGVI